MSGNTKQILTGRLGAVNGTLVGRLGVGTRVEIPTTYVLVDENGNELVALLTDEEVKLTASEKTDIRAGTTAITDKGVVTGEKEIPAYHTYDGYRLVTNGTAFLIPLANYDYTKMQSIICRFNKNLTNSVSAVQVSMYDKVYEVGSTVALASVTKDAFNSRVDFGLTNKSGEIRVLRYIMYKEIY